MEQNNIIHEQERFNLPSVKEQEHTLVRSIKLLRQPLSMTETALEYVKSGLSVIPIGSNKEPTVAHWKPFRNAPANHTELLSWWSIPNLSMAIVCGHGSGELEAIDFDEKYNIDGTPLFDRWKKLVDAEKPGLVERLVGQKSRNKGNHCLYRCSAIEGNKKLAQRAATAEEIKEDPESKSKTLIETRGEGGYLLCYPSPGYAVCNGDLKDIPTITPEEREILITCARALNQLIEETDIVKEKNSKPHGNRSGDKFNRKGDSKALLEKHGWTFVRTAEKGDQWRRPGKAEGISATYFPDTKVFYDFSSNSMLDVGKGYTPFSLFAMLEADGDFSKAAKQLVDQGYVEDEPTEGNLTKVDLFLAERYVFRRNLITQKIEFRPIDENTFKEMRDVDLNSLHMELIRNKLEIGFDAFNRLLISDFVDDYDPIELYFEELQQWDGVTDHVKQLAASLKLKDPSYTKQWEECLQRWLIGYVAGVLDARAVNQTAIILVGPQGIGKSRWLNRLVPEELSKYRFVGTINPDNKDTQVYLSECMLINLDELETLKKAEIGALKTTMTQHAVKVRRPYGRLTEDLPRRASFVGSINQTEFMNDVSGSRRFLAFEIESIDMASFPDIGKVLAHAYALFRQGERWWFDLSEIAQINDWNKQFAIATYEEELVLRKATSKPKPDREMWLTATEIAEHLKRFDDKFQINDRIVRNLGVALTKHQYRYKKSNGSKKYALGWV